MLPLWNAILIGVLCLLVGFALMQGIYIVGGRGPTQGASGPTQRNVDRVGLYIVVVFLVGMFVMSDVPFVHTGTARLAASCGLALGTVASSLWNTRQQARRT